MAYTGGELNNLNGKYGISAPYKSVPVMKLIKEHRPKTKEELYELIRYHHENNCTCGVKSQGTVEDFGKNLYDAQIREWGHYKYSLQECVQWEYDLFVIQSLKGTDIENKAVFALQTELKEYKVIVAEGFVDEELRIDLIVLHNGIEKCGIQVKPHTFNYMRPGVKTFNKAANAKWGKPVHYLYYDENESFRNLPDVIELIKK
jgi:hypothetical protein